MTQPSEEQIEAGALRLCEVYDRQRIEDGKRPAAVVAYRAGSFAVPFWNEMAKQCALAMQAALPPPAETGDDVTPEMLEAATEVAAWRGDEWIHADKLPEIYLAMRALDPAIASRLSSAGDDELVARLLRELERQQVPFAQFPECGEGVVVIYHSPAVDLVALANAANRLEALSRKGRE